MYMFFLNIVFGELWFYVLHRINHTRTLYQYIHKIHHKDPNPIGILAFYSHPLECLFVNVFSSYIIHYFYTVSLFQYIFFITFVNINTIFYSHSSNSFENSTHLNVAFQKTKTRQEKYPELKESNDVDPMQMKLNM